MDVAIGLLDCLKKIGIIKPLKSLLISFKVILNIQIFNEDFQINSPNN